MSIDLHEMKLKSSTRSTQYPFMYSPFSASAKKSDPVKYYETHLARLSANFALSADLALALGGRLKFEEMLSGRFADAFGTLYLGYACLWYYQQLSKDGVKMDDGMKEVLEISMEQLLQENQTALLGLADNFPLPGIGPLIGALCFPLGRPFHGPNDRMRLSAAKAITHPSAFRSVMEENIFISKNPSNRVRMLLDTLPLAVEADKMVAMAKKAKRALTSEEQKLVDKVTKFADSIVQVDVFGKIGSEVREDDAFVRPALRGTRFAELAVGAMAVAR